MSLEATAEYTALEDKGYAKSAYSESRCPGISQGCGGVEDGVAYGYLCTKNYKQCQTYNKKYIS